MATTTNFGWETPDDTDLVKDGAAAMRTLGNAIDTSLVDLKGGTTGQILSKASNTDLDYTWINNDQGDITEVTAGTGLTGGGTSGAVSLAFDVANYGGGQYAAGKNKIINGDFRINQRAFSSTTTYGAFGFDRFWLDFSGGTATYSAQTFTAGAAPVAGYEAINFARLVTTGQSANTNYASINQRIEDVRTLANQTVTVSLWAKASTGTPNIGVTLEQNFGTGGSGGVATSASVKAISTSWARYTFSINVPSISGKTIGTGSFLQLYTFTSCGTSVSAGGYAAVGLQNVTIDIWGVQVEAGSTATPFQTATGTIQGELAACQRYYRKSYDTETAPGTATTNGAVTFYSPNTSSYPWFPTANFGINMRSVPTVTTYNPSTGSTTNPVRNITSSTNHPLFISQTGVNAISAYVDNSSITSGNVISYHYVASAEL